MDVKDFKASMTLEAKDTHSASIIWASIYPNFSSRDLKEGKLEAELKGCEIYVVVKDESLSKLRARLSSILVWLNMVCAILEIWGEGNNIPSELDTRGPNE
ncbi:MAG: KEOPS complex subunit Pcc1 [Candidatus Bathyarchaeia archaeon]